MKIFALGCVLAVAFLLSPQQEKARRARPYQTAVGPVEKLGNSAKIRVNWEPCGNGKYLIFTGNIRIKDMGKRQCNNGRTYDAVQVTQCGGDNDQNDPICHASD